MTLNIVCCVKQVPDPEAPARTFKVDEAARRPIPAQGVNLVVSQFDALAVEAAMRLRDSGADVKVTILTLGPASARDAIKSCLAMGADEGVLLDDASLLDGDPYATATALAAAIRKIGDVGLVLTGRQATDWDYGITGPAIAELLGLTSLTLAKSVAVNGDTVKVERVLGDAMETVEAPLPALVTISNELGEPRYPKLPQILAAGKKQVTIWTAADLGLGASDIGPEGSRLSLERLYIPVAESQCDFVEGDTPEEMAQNLARRLREAKII